MDNLSLSDDDVYLLVKSIGHTADSDCDCFTTTELIQAGELLEKFSKLPFVQSQKEAEEEVRRNGEP